MSTGSESNWESASREEISTFSRKLSDLCGIVVKVCNDEIGEILLDSDYDDIHSLISKIDNRYEHHISAADLSFEQLSLWVNTPHRKYKRKLLLALKQGLVCNRCHKVCSWGELTPDEIIPKSQGGKATLRNSQLLCLKCNNEKDSQPRDELDIAAFDHQGATCIHELNCTERD